MARIDQTPFPIAITDLSHDGRGVGRRDGKAVFVSGALPGEQVMAVQTKRSRAFDEGRTHEVLVASPDRVTPRCPHFGTCSGCVLQHLAEDRQILAKQHVLAENLERIGKVAPRTWLAPLTGASWGYRRKGRFSVRYVEKKGKTLVGFRELDPRFVADLRECHTAVPQVGFAVEALAALIDSMDGRRDIPQVEFIAGDHAAALTFRHLAPLSHRDHDALLAFGAAHGFTIFLQPGGVDSVHRISPEPVDLTFALPAHGVDFAFEPLDFIQVNAALNHAMVDHALALLAPHADDRVLDLFAGLGNFTLPLARHVREVVGVEGDARLVARARANATRNGLANAQFHAADLTTDLRTQPWMAEGFTKLLLDPPRSGADAVLAQLPLEQFERIVYVSCHPGSLSRDAGYLVNERGWVLQAAGVMDMFPHTAHVESIALFVRP